MEGPYQGKEGRGFPVGRLVEDFWDFVQSGLNFLHEAEGKASCTHWQAVAGREFDERGAGPTLIMGYHSLVGIAHRNTLCDKGWGEMQGT